MLNSLIIILREVLEASIIISILLATMNKTSLSRMWIVVAALLGFLGSALMASQFSAISNSFEGVGQELLNATILFTIACLLSYFVFLYIRYQYISPKINRTLSFIITTIVCLSISREGVEIYIYVYGYISSVAENLSLIIGASIGAGIGISTGALAYYGLTYAHPNVKKIISCIAFALISAGMLKESLLYLMQADWIESTTPLWDSSTLISETSLTGQLLYALFAYEATPTTLQVIVYLVTLLAFIVLINYGRLLNKRSKLALSLENSQQ